MKNRIIICLILTIVFFISSCSSNTKEEVKNNEKKTISNTGTYNDIKIATKKKEPGDTSCVDIDTLTGTQEIKTHYTKTDVDKKAEKLEIVLFHSTNRCYTCKKMEELIMLTLEEYFKGDIESSRIKFESVNGDLKEKNEIVKKYGSTGLSIFINSIYDGTDHIVQETKAWRLISDDEKFKEYFKNLLDNL